MEKGVELERLFTRDTPEAYRFFTRAIDFELIRSLLGRRLIERWDLWKPSIDALGGESVYPMFAALVSKMRLALGAPEGEGSAEPNARSRA